MYKDEIKEVNEWFRKRSKVSYGTYHHTKQKHGEELYNVSSYDVDAFCDFLMDSFPDMIGFNCTIGGSGIWFHRSDLEDSASY